MDADELRKQLRKTLVTSNRFKQVELDDSFSENEDSDASSTAGFGGGLAPRYGHRDSSGGGGGGGLEGISERQDVSLGQDEEDAASESGSESCDSDNGQGESASESSDSEEDEDEDEDGSNASDDARGANTNGGSWTRGPGRSSTRWARSRRAAALTTLLMGSRWNTCTPTPGV